MGAMIALVLFIVFMALWLVSVLPVPSNPGTPYGGVFAWLSVLMLGFVTHAIHFS